MPNASSLLFYKPEGKDERLARMELGFETDESLDLAASMSANNMNGVEPSAQGEDGMELDLPATTTTAVSEVSLSKSVLSGGMFDLPPVAPVAPTPVVAPIVVAPTPTPMAVEPSTTASAPIVEATPSVAAAASTSLVQSVTSTIVEGAKSTSKLWEDKPAAVEEEDSDGEIPEIDMGGDSSDEEEDDE